MLRYAASKALLVGPVEPLLLVGLRPGRSQGWFGAECLTRPIGLMPGCRRAVDEEPFRETELPPSTVSQNADVIRNSATAGRSNDTRH